MVYGPGMPDEQPKKWPKKWPWTIKESQWSGAVLVAAAVLVLAATKFGPFDDPPPLSSNPGFFELLLRERYTLGLVRLGLAVLAAFVVVSVPALIIAGRWLKGFTKEGLTADDVAEAGNSLAELETQLKDVSAERDSFVEQAEELRDRALRAEVRLRILEEIARQEEGGVEDGQEE